MATYFIIILLPAALWLVFKKNGNISIWYLRITLAVLFFISSFRDANIGTDYERYIQELIRMANGGVPYFERGFVILNKIASFFTMQPYGLAIIVNLLLFISLYHFIKTNIESRFWALCVFVFVANPYLYIQSTFNMLRQCCATSIMLWSVNSLYKKRWLQYLLFILIAAQFHKMAYTFVILIPLRLIRWKRSYWVAIASVCLLLNLVGYERILARVANIFGFGVYVNYEASMLNVIPYILLIFVYILWLCHHYKNLTQDKRGKFFLDFYIFSLCFLLLAVRNDAVYRVYITFAFISLPALQFIWDRARKFQEGMIFKIGYPAYYVCFYCGYIGYLYITQNANYIPFQYCFG